ncbi:MAG TPA: hypothetical protein VMY42_21855 [Thermoguttaceae bacterium]|nr:hypothetical protein [Thermoguttaceae bacterium]
MTSNVKTAHGGRRVSPYAFTEQGMPAPHKQLAAAGTSQDKTVIQCQIDATDRQTEGLVYELYKPSDEEIAIVEKATG